MKQPKQNPSQLGSWQKNKHASQRSYDLAPSRPPKKTTKPKKSQENLRKPKKTIAPPIFKQQAYRLSLSRCHKVAGWPLSAGHSGSEALGPSFHDLQPKKLVHDGKPKSHTNTSKTQSKIWRKKVNKNKKPDIYQTPNNSTTRICSRSLEKDKALGLQIKRQKSKARLVGGNPRKRESKTRNAKEKQKLGNGFFSLSKNMFRQLGYLVCPKRERK